MNPNHLFSQYLRTLVNQDPELLSNEMYFMTVNCSQKGLHFDVSVQPLFISSDLTHTDIVNLDIGLNTYFLGY